MACFNETEDKNIFVLDVTRRVITLLSGGGLSINGKHIYCGDYIFSGHTMTLTMAYMTIKQCEYTHETITKYRVFKKTCQGCYKESL